MDKDTYALPRGSAETDRLNRQHDIFVRALGYTFHPDIEATIGPDTKIADIATGTGIALVKFSSIVPKSCELDGFDISDAQFPPPESLPPNITLLKADAKRPFSKQYHGRYDVVFVRLLVLALMPGDWELVSRGIYSILKPGGWVQWIESDIRQAMTWLRLDPKVPAPATDAVFSAIRPHSADWNYAARELEGILQKVGFEHVLHEVTSNDRLPEDRRLWNANTMTSLEGTLFSFEQRKGSSGLSPEECAQLVNDMREEERKGAFYSRHDIHVFVSRKL